MASERPIIFSGPMVRALLEGRKTQHRLPLKSEVPPRPADLVSPRNAIKHAAPYLDAYCSERKSPENPRGMSQDWCWWTRDDRCGACFKVGYAPGNRLWAREAWARVGDEPDDIHACPDLRVHVYYRADSVCPEHQRWRSPIHMPRWASRLTLLVTDVRVQRLQDISEADAEAEGVEHDTDGWRDYLMPSTQMCTSARGSFETLWQQLHGADACDANPWTCAITFECFAKNIDQIAEAA